MSEDGLAKFIPKIIRLIKKRDAKGLLLVIATFFLSLSAGLLASVKYTIPHTEIIVLIILAVSLVLVLWLLLVFWRYPLGIDIPKEVVPPKSVNGLAPFTEAEGDFFYYLGRSSEIDRLVKQTLNREFPITVLHGEPGSGKTSLLKAGLCHQLSKVKTPYAYWRATKGCTAEEFEHAVNTQIEKESKDFAVIIIDQFEQLHIDAPEHARIFESLKDLCNKSAPYQRKVVIAFREQYHSDWLNLDHELNGALTGELPIPLGPWSPESAKEILATILLGTGVIVDDEPLDLYVRSAAVNQGVSPLDIGFGSLAFSSWARSTRRRHLQLSHYRKSGGATGILVTHVEQLFKEYVPIEYHELLLKGLYNSLLDTERTQMNQGATTAKIAKKSGLSIDSTASCLEHLAAPDARVVESVHVESGKETYKLTHKRLVQVLQLKHKKGPSKADKAALYFSEQYGRWKQTKRWIHLLSILDFWQALFHKDHLAQLVDKRQREKYLRKSAPLLGIKMSGFVSLVLVVMFYQSIFRGPLAKWHFRSIHIPSDLYDRQHEIDSLSIEITPVPDLRWLQSTKLSELNINARESIEGIANGTGLQTVILNLSNSKMSTLQELGRLHGIKALTLYLGESQILNLGDLRTLGKLENLTLYLSGSRIHDITDLRALPGLTVLNLNLQKSPVIEGLTALSTVTDLTLNLEESPIQEMPDLTALHSLRTLKINLQKSKIKSLANITELNGLRNLDLNLEECSSIQGLPDLSELTSLEILKLNLNDTSLTNLPRGMEHLENLHQLSLDLTTAHIAELPDLRQFRQLQSLDLDLGPDISRLVGLAGSTVSRLALKFNHSIIPSLRDLNQIPNLSTIELDIRALAPSNLPDLSQLKQVQNLTLTLHLEWPQLSSLPDLSILKGLRTAVFDLSGGHLDQKSAVRELSRLTKLDRLRNLTLNLAGSDIPSLPDFAEPSDLDTLSLDLAKSQMTDLSNLSRLTKLTDLTLHLEQSRQSVHLTDVNALTKLHKLSLYLDGSNIQELPTLVGTNELQTLVLSLPVSEIRSLPDLHHLKLLQNVMLDFRRSPVTDLSQTQRLPALKEVILDQRFQFLAELPDTVRKLSFRW